MKQNKILTTKIGQGYYQSGYGRGFKKNPIVRLINGKAYVKDATQTPFQTDLEGYVMVNAVKTGEQIFFAAIGLISEHKEYTMETKYTTLHIANDDLKLILQSFHALRMQRINLGSSKFEDIKRLEHILEVALNTETLINENIIK